MIASLEVIRSTLGRAQPHWWKSTSAMSQSQNKSLSQASSEDSSIDLGVAQVSSDLPEEDDDGEIVDLNNMPLPSVERGNKNDASDSDATTLGYNMDDDDGSISEPVLKRQKKQSRSTTTIVASAAAAPAHPNAGKLPKSKSQIAPIDDDDSIATEARNDIEIHSPEDMHGSKSNVKNIQSGRSKNKITAFTENQTPQDLNKSCSIPEESFRLSPIITVGNSQNNLSSLKEVGFLDDISEEMETSDMGATTESIGTPSVRRLESSLNGIDADATCYKNTKEASDACQESTVTKQSAAEDQKTETAIGSQAKQKYCGERSNVDDKGKSTTTLGDGRAEESTSTNSSSRPPIPQVFLISPSLSLSSTDQRSLRKHAKNDRLHFMKPEKIDGNEMEIDLDFNYDFDSKEDVESFLNSLYSMDNTCQFPVQYSYAVCSNAEYQTFEGYIMPRSFRFVLAVACGLSIIDITYLKKGASTSFGIRNSSKYLYAPGTFQYNCSEASRGNRRKRLRGKETEQNDENYQVAGDVDSIELMGPQRSRKALMKRIGACSGKKLVCNNGLLDQYEAILFGDFDYLSASQPSSKRRGGRGNAESSNDSRALHDNIYTKGRVSLLLSLCGATISDLNSFDDQRLSECKTLGKTIFILTRNDANAQVKNRIESIMRENGISDEKVKGIPILCCKWLEDSIAAFKVKEIDESNNR